MYYYFHQAQLVLYNSNSKLETIIQNLKHCNKKISICAHNLSFRKQTCKCSAKYKYSKKTFIFLSTIKLEVELFWNLFPFIQQIAFSTENYNFLQLEIIFNTEHRFSKMLILLHDPKLLWLISVLYNYMKKNITL